jgi:hypothetical protein
MRDAAGARRGEPDQKTLIVLLFRLKLHTKKKAGGFPTFLTDTISFAVAI